VNEIGTHPGGSNPPTPRYKPY